MKAAILTDVTRCVGCNACTMACKEANALVRDEAAQLSASTWTHVGTHQGVHVRRQCMHCLDPACVSVCPVAALHKTAQGPVIYREERCMGCRYCMVACPFGVPKYEWASNTPRVRKCIMCFERFVSQGQQPACTGVCPTGATIFGDREALLAQAHARIEAEPKRYLPHVYGEYEAGGTSVLYLSAVPFNALGFPAGLLQDPYPRLTWNVLSRLPQVVSVAAVALVGTWWIIRRRQQLAETAADGHGTPHANEITAANNEAKQP